MDRSQVLEGVGSPRVDFVAQAALEFGRMVVAGSFVCADRAGRRRSRRRQGWSFRASSCLCGRCRRRE